LKIILLVIIENQINQDLIVDKGIRIIKKNIVFENNYWKISGSHDGYQKKFQTIHEREIEFYPEQMKFIRF
jgi:uncharacterized heparinase superfamily protein